MIHKITGFPGREIGWNNRKYLYFGGTAYLGLQTDKEFQRLYIRNLKRYGTNYGASRKSNVQLSVYEETENYLASWVGCEAALTVSSGYLAGQLACSHFSGENFKLFHAPHSHSALFLAQPAGKRTKPYVTYTSLNIALREHLAKHRKVAPVLCLDTIDFSGNNYPLFEGLRSLPLKELIIVADDSHGIGVIGPDGSGAFSALSEFPAKELLVCCSLGKAMALQAGAIFGTKQRITQLTNTDFFGGASPPSPASLASFLQAGELYAKKRALLIKNMELFSRESGPLPKMTHISEHPSWSYTDEGLTNHLEHHGFIITDFAYPNADTRVTNRIILTAGHVESDLQSLAGCLRGYAKK